MVNRLRANNPMSRIGWWVPVPAAEVKRLINSAV
jgi:hypothetical protein